MNTKNSTGPATSSLLERILAQISQKSAIPFTEFMEIALYDPELGYYSRGAERVGREGDFFTSVSVGNLFGKLLAIRFADWWKAHGKPTRWRILEIGANDGRLAEDILRALSENFPDASQGLEYAISEPIEQMRSVQLARLKNFPENVRIVENAEVLKEEKLPGIAFGNEILDALPFHLVRFEKENWQELHVTAGEKSDLSFEPQAIRKDTVLADRLEDLGNDFPDGYQTEIRTCFQSFLQAACDGLIDGTLIFIDYGFAKPEYYFPSRTTGTLRTFSRHQAAEDPLDRPGEIDITAHVDFTELARAADSIGYGPTYFGPQASYLTHLAKSLIVNGELQSPKDIQQFQTLTHPSHLGEKFHVIELEPGASPNDSVTHRLAL